MSDDRNRSRLNDDRGPSRFSDDRDRSRSSDGVATLRIDKWLWHARLAKTRSLAARLCALGAVELSGRPVAKPNQAVRVGSQIAVVQGRQRRRVEVLGLGTRRGPAAEAQALYRELVPPEPLQRIPEDWVPLLAED